MLNASVMRLFHEVITRSDNKRDDMKIENCEDGGEIVVEKYKGRNSSGYVKEDMQGVGTLAHDLLQRYW